MHNANKGVLLIISGPSGVGKGTVLSELLARDGDTVYSVSATTRTPREGEIEGKNYFFLTKDEFIRRRDNGEFLEWAEVFGNYYGTPKAAIEALLNSGKNVILEIDTQGAMQIKSACPNGIFIFIMPPSYEELKRRIVQRGSESGEELQRRLGLAHHEMNLAEQYDYSVINNNIEQTAAELLDIIRQVKEKRALKMTFEEKFKEDNLA